MRGRDELPDLAEQSVSGPIVWPMDGSVLIVDDLAFIRDIYCRQLSRIGARCYSAATHPDALRTVQERDIVVVVLDYDMGESNPGELVEQLRQVKPELKIVGHSGQNRQEEFAAIGVHDFLMKPWDVSDLVRLVSGQP